MTAMLTPRRSPPSSGIGSKDGLRPVLNAAHVEYSDRLLVPIPGTRQNRVDVDLRIAGTEHGSPAALAQTRRAERFRGSPRGGPSRARHQNLSLHQSDKGLREAARVRLIQSPRVYACGEALERGIVVSMVAARARQFLQHHLASGI